MPLSKVLPSLRLAEMPEYAFGQLDHIKMLLEREGKEIIDLSLGSPDHRMHDDVLKTLGESMQKTRNHQYPIFRGHPEFKAEIAKWFKQRFGVDVDPENGVLPLLGSKEGIGHIAFAYIQEGDMSIIPSPYYPVHMRGTVLSGGSVYELELKEENDFVGDLDSIPEDILKRAKILILSYPHNPTGAVVDRAYLEKAVKLCHKYNIILLNDFAYSEIWFDNNKPCSILEIEGAKEVAIEFHTFSKTYNMAGLRLGFAVGNEKVVQTLYKLKTNIDYGVPMAIQEAGITALKLGDEYRESIRLEYQNRRDYVYQSLKDLGFKVHKPGGAMYVWFKIPDSFKDSFDFAHELLEKTGVAVVPGLTFGEFGERYARIALVQPLDVIKKGMEAIKEFKGVLK